MCTGCGAPKVVSPDSCIKHTPFPHIGTAGAPHAFQTPQQNSSGLCSSDSDPFPPSLPLRLRLKLSSIPLLQLQLSRSGNEL